MSAAARAAPNIALIKYWGNRNDTLRLPMADSLSITLDRPTVEITVDHAPALTVQSFDVSGKEKTLKEKDVARFAKHLELTKRYLAELGMPDAIPHAASIVVRSRIPSSIGLASSAAVFGCLAKAYAGLIGQLSDRDISIIARFGSGSAARSIFGGFAALRASEGESLSASYGEQIAPESHWALHDIIVVQSREEKSVGSTEGHAGAHTSRGYAERVEEIRSRREQECIDAVLARDFEALRDVTEEDCWDMHEVMQTQNPPLDYLTTETHRIVQGIIDLRDKEHLEVLYTMDAGPTVHMICTESPLGRVVAYAKAQEERGCTVYETKIGAGAVLLP